jgi:hypothetical protein
MTLSRAPGTLIAIPLVIAFWGSTWRYQTSVVPNVATYVEKFSDSTAPKKREIGLWAFKDGTWWERATVLPPNSHLEVALSRAMSTFSVTLQADFNDAYVIEGSPDGKSYARVWEAPNVTNLGKGLRTRESSTIHVQTPVRFLRISPASGDGYYSVSWIRLTPPPIVIPHWVVIPICWGLWFLVTFTARLPALRHVSSGVLQLWASNDGVLAAVVSYLVLFRISAGAIALLGLFLFFGLLRRWPVVVIPVAGTVLVLATIILPRMLSTIVMANTAKMYKLDVDHRLRPLINNEVNSDGIRFRGEASDLSKNDFVVLFLGDSFTYGERLSYDEAYPYRLERILGDSYRCSQKVRIVNFGWVSSSPLLSLRLLQEIGYKYKPSLITYTLDMTDFNDDLRYEAELRHTEDFKPDTSALMQRLVTMYLPWLPLNVDEQSELVQLLRRRAELQAQAGPSERPETVIRHGERFFVTKYPLEETREEIERGVMRYLGKLNEYARSVLNVPMLLIVEPRAYQYSALESPNNYEKNEYEVLGPYVREPFRYFESVKDKLPYEVFSLLPTFEHSDKFPLYLDDNPHWNADGAAVAAEAVAEFLSRRHYIPCEPHAPPG